MHTQSFLCDDDHGDWEPWQDAYNWSGLRPLAQWAPENGNIIIEKHALKNWTATVAIKNEQSYMAIVAVENKKS